MILLHNIGRRVNSNYNTADEIRQTTGKLSFDGVYANVWEHRELLAQRDVILFVTGKYVGGDNAFDAPMPPERFCTWEQLADLQRAGCAIGYHTWSHPDLTLIGDAELAAEVAVPETWPYGTLEYFAYPYGKFDSRVIEAVRQAGYKAAWSVFDGDNTDFQRRRSYLNW